MKHGQVGSIIHGGSLGRILESSAGEFTKNIPEATLLPPRLRLVHQSKEKKRRESILNIAFSSPHLQKSILLGVELGG